MSPENTIKIQYLFQGFLFEFSPIISLCSGIIFSNLYKTHTIIWRNSESILFTTNYKYILINTLNILFGLEKTTVHGSLPCLGQLSWSPDLVELEPILSWPRRPSQLGSSLMTPHYVGDTLPVDIGLVTECELSPSLAVGEGGACRGVVTWPHDRWRCGWHSSPFSIYRLTLTPPPGSAQSQAARSCIALICILPHTRFTVPC